MKILSFQEWPLLCHAHTYGSFILYWFRKVGLCETSFWYSTVWIIVFWFHAKSQRYQIFTLRGCSCNKIWANTITILHSIQFWSGNSTFKRTVWNGRPHHRKNSRNLCIKWLCLLGVRMISCPNKLSSEFLRVHQHTETSQSSKVFASDSSWVSNAICTLQLIETMSNEQGIIESTIIIERKMFPISLC